METAYDMEFSHWLLAEESKEGGKSLDLRKAWVKIKLRDLSEEIVVWSGYKLRAERLIKDAHFRERNLKDFGAYTRKQHEIWETKGDPSGGRELSDRYARDPDYDGPVENDGEMVEEEGTVVGDDDVDMESLFDSGESGSQGSLGETETEDSLTDQE